MGSPSKKRPGTARRRPGATAGRSPARSGSGSRSRQPVETGLRAAVARRSLLPMVWLSRQPRLLVPGVMLVLMIVGLAAPLTAAVPALLVILAFLTWQTYLSWPVVDPRGRGLRVVGNLVVLFAVVGRVAGWI